MTRLTFSLIFMGAYANVVCQQEMPVLQHVAQPAEVVAVSTKSAQAWKFIKDNSLDVAGVAVACAVSSYLVAGTANYIILRRIARKTIGRLEKGGQGLKGPLDFSKFVLESGWAKLAHFNFWPISICMLCTTAVGKHIATRQPLLADTDEKLSSTSNEQEVTNV